MVMVLDLDQSARCSRFSFDSPLAAKFRHWSLGFTLTDAVPGKSCSDRGTWWYLVTPPIDQTIYITRNQHPTCQRGVYQRHLIAKAWIKSGAQTARLSWTCSFFFETAAFAEEWGKPKGWFMVHTRFWCQAFAFNSNSIFDTKIFASHGSAGHFATINCPYVRASAISA